MINTVNSDNLSSYRTSLYTIIRGLNLTSFLNLPFQVDPSAQLRQGAEGDLREHEDQPPQGEEAHRQGVVLQTLRPARQQWSGINDVIMMMSRFLGRLKTNCNKV